MELPLPQVDSLIPTITAITGLVATATAAAQLSYRHRMMRTASWAQKQISDSTGKHKQHLKTMKKWAESEVFASTLVPSWIFLEPITVAIIGFLTPIISNRSLTQLSIIIFLTFFVEFRRTLRLYLERRRCANKYYAGLPIHPVNIGILFQMEGGTFKEIQHALQIAAELTAISISISHYIRHENPAALIISFISLSFAAFSVRVIRRWERHPFSAHI